MNDSEVSIIEEDVKEEITVTDKNTEFPKEWFKKYRVISLIDMDSFYAQVERRRLAAEGVPITEEHPLAVIQRSICATVNHTARLRGVPKMCSKEQAMAICPEIITVPSVMPRYKEASKDVIKTLLTMFPIVERSSIDESFVDLTAQCVYIIHSILETLPSSEKSDLNVAPIYEFSQEHIDQLRLEIFALYDHYCSTLSDEHKLFAVQKGLPPMRSNFSISHRLSFILSSLPARIYPEECGEEYETSKKGALLPNLESLLLAVGTRLMAAAKATIASNLLITCAAGISTNKLLAKLACPLNKPNNLTIIRPEASIKLIDSRGLKRIPYLGPKILEALHSFNLTKPCELRHPENLKTLQEIFDSKTVNFLIDRCNAIDNTEVQDSAAQKSLSVEAAVRSLREIRSIAELLRTQVKELLNRLAIDENENQRRASTIVLRYRNQRWHGEFNADFDFSNENTAKIKTMRLEASRALRPAPFTIDELFPLYMKMFQAACPRPPYDITLLGVGVKDFVPLPKVSNREKIDYYFVKKPVEETKKEDEDSIEELDEAPLTPLAARKTKKNNNLVIRCARCKQLLYIEEAHEHAQMHFQGSIEKFFLRKKIPEKKVAATKNSKERNSKNP